MKLNRLLLSNNPLVWKKTQQSHQERFISSTLMNKTHCQFKACNLLILYPNKWNNQLKYAFCIYSVDLCLILKVCKRNIFSLLHISDDFYICSLRWYIIQAVPFVTFCQEEKITIVSQVAFVKKPWRTDLFLFLLWIDNTICYFFFEVMFIFRFYFVCERRKDSL